MAGFDMILAGGLAGAGDSIREQARAKREAALRAQEREQERAWEVEDRDRSYAEDRGREQRGYDRADSNIRMGADALEAVFGPGNAGGAERIAQITDFYISKGAPPHVAAGLAGNFMQESGPSINTTAVGDNGNAFGAGQWNGPRRRELQAYAQENGLDVNDLGTQLEFSWQEMQTTERSAWEAIMGTETAEEAARVASERYWRPGTPHIERRQDYARTVFEAMSNPEIPADVRERIGNGLGMDPEPAPESEESAPAQPETSEPVEPAELSAGLDTRLRRNGKLADANGFDGEVDEDLLLEVKSEIARLMTEEGLNESQAEIAVLQAITFEEVEVSPARPAGIMNWSADPAVTERGAVRFDYGTGAEPEPDGSQQPPEPDMPSDPGQPSLGGDPVAGPAMPAPTDPAERVVGQVYRNARGQLARWNGEGWELVNG
jgi:hypothetical protein